MGSFTARVRKLSWAEAALLAPLALWTLSATGCVLGDDTRSPVLAVDVRWDRSVSERFSAGSCETAGVVWISWTLRSAGGELLEESKEGGEECVSGFDFFDLRPGDYTLSVEGYDDSDTKLWQDRCRLQLGRFDQLFSCPIDKIASGPDSAADDADAGADE